MGIDDAGLFLHDTHEYRSPSAICNDKSTTRVTILMLFILT